MIINGGSRSNGGFFARHLMRADDNERVTVAEMRGFAYAQDVPEAFRELSDLANGTRCKNYFYHANINARPDEAMTPEQWAQAVDTLEHELRLDGQPRFVVEHEKEGRIHRHVVWGRIDPDSMTAISDSHNYRTHELVASELESAFGQEATARALTRDKEATPRPEPNVKDWESFRAAESKIDPKAIKAELTELWQHADSGPAFAAALEERGYILARGDRRDFCVIDAAGDEHSLARRISGVKAAEIRERMADVNREALPSVDEARHMARSRLEEPTGEPADMHQAKPEQAAPAEETPAGKLAELSPFDAVMRERIEEARPNQEPSTRPAAARQMERERPTFERVMHEAAQEAEAAQQAEAREADAAGGGTRWERFSAWLSTMREHVVSFGHQVRDYWNSHFGAQEQEPQPAEQPETTIHPQGQAPEPMQQRPQQPYQGPEIG